MLIRFTVLFLISIQCFASGQKFNKKFGLKEKDILISVNGISVSDETSAKRLSFTLKTSKLLELVYSRNNELFVKKVKLSE